jgi:glycogen operon protein
VTLLHGRPHPLGATWDGEGVNFALYSAHANGVDLCLFESVEGPETRRMALPGRSGHVWHAYLPGAAPGLLYGYRVSGPWCPEEGLRFDPSKLVVDPRAQALSGPVIWDEALAAPPGAPTARDTAPFVPRAVVVDPSFDWGDDRPPRTAWSRTVLYECHVKGMTQRHPGVPESLRGRYLGLAEPAVTDHLRALGVTALSLLPVHHAAIDAHLGRRALPNYWGYGTLGFFAPDARFASGGRGEQVREFRSMVRALHRAGLEVILDVVYNHTPETDARGATLGLRGIDDRSYYRHDPKRPGEYRDWSGCGNALDVLEPPGLDLVLDSLRYWVSEMHVDGFRFDLAPALCRDARGRFDRGAPFLEELRADPVLSQVKLVAEPWDLGPDPNQLGAFPAPFVEWNDRFRDVVRRFWCGDPHVRPRLSAVFAGSGDVFGPGGRTPQASVNFVTCHDGFTLADLVSYDHKHNEANLEGSRDGRHMEPSCSFGVEGPTDRSEVLRERERTRRNLVAMLALSLGVPMLSHGDELGRTQRGNNNAYCHDSELTWVDWRMDAGQEAFRDFVRSVFALRRANAVFRRSRHLTGELSAESGMRDVSWLRPDGEALEGADWVTPGHAFAILLSAEAADPLDENGKPQVSNSALLLLNGGPEPVRFSVPELPRQGGWSRQLDTAGPAPPERDASSHLVRPRSLVVLEWQVEP